MKPIPIIILCLLLTSCATKNIKHITPPTITISFPEDLDEESKTSLTNAILNAKMCDMPNTSITITITEYYKSNPSDRFLGSPIKKGITIKGTATTSPPNQPPFTLNFISNTRVGGLLGILEFDQIHMEKQFANNLFNKSCRKYQYYNKLPK